MVVIAGKHLRFGIRAFQAEIFQPRRTNGRPESVVRLSSIARAHDPADTHSRSFHAQSPFHKDPDDAAFTGLEEQEKALDNKHIMFYSCHPMISGVCGTRDMA
jgi:hypothetical protein